MGNNGSKVKGLFTEIKTHWNKPAKGKYVPYKEYLDILFGVGANYAGNKTLEYISFAAGCYLMMYHYKLPYQYAAQLCLDAYRMGNQRQPRIFAKENRA